MPTKTTKAVTDDAVQTVLAKLIAGHTTELQIAVNNGTLISMLLDKVNGLTSALNSLTAIAAINAVALEEIRHRLGLRPNPRAVAIMQAVAVAEQTVPAADVVVANDIGTPIGTA